MIPSEKKYCSNIEKKTWVHFGSPGKYMNHSCEANTNACAVKWGDVALMDIKKGEEITCDYEQDNTYAYFECNCKNKSCRKKY